ncbi:hypothetical protein C8A00DRAFT_33105 [Chaetomidium leptoderma]|uniref:DUF7136 domain-containing protein n=1 Tax=Chaetomidium leptoderma TaxID=669021 RepID=A0AAN6VNR9_9PEZI|nr:hypothetical protein C8A00DRAFT_33105 [Chaetomidium leptoderma]
MTHAPAPVFPIVFAVQNLATAWPSTLIQLYWSVVRVGEYRVAYDFITLPNTNSSHPYYINLWTGWLNETAPTGTYSLGWSSYYNNCSDPAEEDFNGLTAASIKGDFFFTIEPGAQQPDFAADLDICPEYNATFEITGTSPIRSSGLSTQPRDVCAIVAASPPPANPCAARVDKAAASSISAELTASACATSPPVLTSGCPPPGQTSEKSLGSGVSARDAMGMLLGPLLAGLLFALH